MLHVAVDPDQHPVDQYRYDAEWSDILQYLALLYLHSKVDYYKEVGKASEYNTMMNRYRDVDLYARDFMRMMEEVLDAKEYAHVKGQLENAHAAIKARNFKPLWLRQAFRNIKDDLPHVHSPRIKNVLRPLIEYFKNGAEHALETEQEAITGMKRIRNPRLRKVLQTVETDLPNMAAPKPEYKADKDTIDKMSRVEILKFAANSEDDETLRLLLESGNRSAIAALFQRGYLQGSAARIYLNSKLVTPGNFKKLSDEVCFKYLTNMPWDWTREKVRGRSVWKDWYNTILTAPGKEKLLKMLVQEAIDNPYGDLNEKELIYRIAANHLPVNEMTPDIVTRVWKYADDPDPLVRKISKADRIEKYRTSYRQLSESVWLYDLNKDELIEFLKDEKLTERDFISHHFGSSWGPFIQDGGDDENVVVWRDFWGKLSSDDVDLLQTVGMFEEKVHSALVDGYKIDRYPGGRMKFFDDVYDSASKDGQLYLLTFLPRRYLEHIRSRGTTDDADLNTALDAAMQAKEDAAKQKIVAWRERYGKELESAPTREWKKMVESIPAKDVLPAYKHWVNSGSYYYYWHDIEKSVAANCTKEDLAEFIDMTWKTTYDSQMNEIWDIVMTRLDPSMSLQLVRVDNPVVRKWVADNYPINHVLTLLQGNETYYEHICDFAERVDGDMVTTLLAHVQNDWPSTLTSYADKQTAAVACLVKKLPTNADSYLDSPDVEVRRSAMVSASKDRSLKALEENEYPLLSYAAEREDFLEDPIDFVAAYLKNPKLQGDWVHGDYKAALKHLDSAVLKMSEAQFLELIVKIDEMLDNGPREMRDSKPWGLGAYIRYVNAGAPANVASALQDRMNVRTTLPDISKSLSTTDLVNAAQKGPWDDVNDSVWYILAKYRYKDTEWVYQLDSAEIKHILDVVKFDLSYRVRNVFDAAFEHRKETEKYEKKGSLLDRVNAALETDDYATVAKILADGYEDPEQAAATGDLVRQIYTKTRDEHLKIQIVAHGSADLLDKLAENNVLARSLVLMHCSDDYFNARFDKLKARHLDYWMPEPDSNKPRSQGATKDTRQKSAMIARANADQALELFKFFYSEQREFGPKVREAFLEKLDEADFAKKLKKFLLSKSFNLRYRKFTMEMLPIVLKLDDTDVTAKFNGSSVFRAKAIGGLGKAWKDLKTKKEKEEFLDDIKDRTMMERLLRILVEETISLRSPVNEEFVIGSNAPDKTATFLSSFQQATSTTSHAELFRLSCDHASTSEIREWLLEEPLRVFDYSKATTDVTTRNLRIDWVDDRTNKQVAQRFLDTWDKRVHGSFRADVTRVYGVETPRTPKRTSGTTKILYHGTDYFAAGCIIQGGFKVMRSYKAGRLLGDGIYFSDIGSKVAQYLHAGSGSGVSRGKGSGVVLVCEVDLGNMLNYANMRGGVNSKNWMRHGYDSIYMERGQNYGGGRILQNNEYCVADVSRIKILYVMDISRDRVAY